MKKLILISLSLIFSLGLFSQTLVTKSGVYPATTLVNTVQPNKDTVATVGYVDYYVKEFGTLAKFAVAIDTLKINDTVHNAPAATVWAVGSLDYVNWYAATVDTITINSSVLKDYKLMTAGWNYYRIYFSASKSAQKLNVKSHFLIYKNL